MANIHTLDNSRRPHSVYRGDPASRPLIPGADGSSNQHGCFVTVMNFMFPGFGLLTFTFLISMVDIIMFIVSLSIGGFMHRGAFLSPNPYTLYILGAKWAPDMRHRYHFFRFFTPMFLHGGFLHIMFNLLAQMQFGFIMERTFGVVRVAAIYVVSAAGGVLLSCLAKPLQPSVGASGAVFGLVGAMLAYLISNWRDYGPARERTLIILIFILLINFLMGFLAGDEVDNWAHLGGLFVGIFMVLILVEPLQFRSWKRKSQLISLSLLTAYFAIGLSVFFTVLNVPDVRLVE